MLSKFGNQFSQLSIEQKDELINELLLLVPLVKALKQKVADLENQLNQNSRNSHKPPSTDGFKKIKIQHEKSSKRSGGQIGHKGQTLKICNKPDKIIEYPLDICTYCRSNIKNTDHVGYKVVAQVFDLPQMKIEVTEHRVFEKICPDCGKICSANLPQGLIFGPQYGIYECNHALCNGHHLRELEAVFEETFHDWARQMQKCLRKRYSLPRKRDN